jgi:hypothetical protein
LRRRLASEVVARLPSNFFEQHHDTRRKLARWAEDIREAIEAFDGGAAGSGNDRAQDNWRPLYAIAAAIGGN